MTFSKDPVKREYQILNLIKRNKEMTKSPEWKKKNREHLDRICKDPEWLRKVTEANQLKAQDTKWKENVKKGAQKRSKNINWIKNNKESCIKRSQNPEWIKKHEETYKSDEWIRKQKEGCIKRSQNPEWKKNQKEGIQKSCKDLEWLRKVTEANQLKSQNPEWVLKHNESIRKCTQNPEWKKNQKEGIRGVHKRPEWIRNHKEGMIKRSQNPEWIEMMLILNNGQGFWYGNVRNDDKIYCEKWNEDLRKRIRAYWNYKSVLSGKTKEGNGGRELSCHHVYYQKSACCTWDEDKQGYYAWIDNEKYYIKGDPNKFVTLTSSEHGLVMKNKLKWIKIFEDIIEKQGGKCFFTKEEVKEMRESQGIYY